MSLWQSLIFGILQGVSEFIPISSSGHLVVMRSILGVDEIPLLYDVVLHVATLIVVVFFFRERIARILAALWRWVTRSKVDDDRARDDGTYVRLAGLVIVATVVTVAIGLGIRSLDLHLYPKIVSAAFLVTAALLILAHFAKGSTDYAEMTSRHALIVGAVQGLAVIPGISRSGSTITAALYTGVSRERAGEFSFLLSVPAILGALVLEARDLGSLTAAVSPVALLAGFAAALVFGFLSLSLLVRLVRLGRLWVFSIYLIPLGVWGLIAL